MLKVKLVTIGRFWHFHLARQLLKYNLLDEIYSGYPKFKLVDEKNIPSKKIKTYPYYQVPYLFYNRYFQNTLPFINHYLSDLSHKKIAIKVSKNIGNSNVLIGTSVGEEGIDIPSVELIIFYEPVPSAIRTVQRRGRTGRLEDGEVIVLVAKGTRDEAYRWTAYHKENRMHRVLKGMKTKFNLGNSQETTLNDFKDKKKWKMFVDSREKGSGIARFLVDKDVDVTMQNLDVGDFIVSERVGIERKEIRDFVDSIVDKRVLHQLKSLKDTFERPILIIEGIEDIYSVRKVHPNAIRGMLAWIAVDLKIPIIYTKDFRDTGEFLITLAKREQEENEKEFGVRGEKKPLSTKELQEYIVSGLPGVGPSLAKNLLKEFVTVKKIINASEDELKDVDKIGKKKASEIRKVLEEKYKE